MRHLLTALFALLALASCDFPGNTLAHHYESPARQRWGVRDTLLFTLPEADVSGDYLFSVGMRLGVAFPYAGVWAVAEVRLHNPDTLWRDTLYYPTTRPDGRPYGNGMNLQLHELPFATLRLLRGQRGEVLLYHIMRSEYLPEVHSVGVRVERQI